MSQFGRNTVGRLNVEIDADGTKARAELDATSAKMEETAQKAERSTGRLTGAINRGREAFTRFTGVITGTIGAFTAWVSIIGLAVTAVTSLIAVIRRLNKAADDSTASFSAFMDRVREDIKSLPSISETVAAEFDDDLKQIEERFGTFSDEFIAAYLAVIERTQREVRENVEQGVQPAIDALNKLLDPGDAPIVARLKEIQAATEAIASIDLAASFRNVGEVPQDLADAVSGGIQRGVEAQRELISSAFADAAQEVTGVLQAPFALFRQGVAAYEAAVREQVQAQRDATAAQNRAMTEAIENAIEARIGDTLRSIEASLNRNLTSVDDAARAAQFVALNRSRPRDG